jgi:hypothetical protein
MSNQQQQQQKLTAVNTEVSLMEIAQAAFKESTTAIVVFTRTQVNNTADAIGQRVYMGKEFIESFDDFVKVGGHVADAVTKDIQSKFNATETAALLRSKYGIPTPAGYDAESHCYETNEA